MTAHRELLARVVQEFETSHPGCSLLLAGSVMRGQEHAGSDIDLFGAFDDIKNVCLEGWRTVHASQSARVIQGEIEGIGVVCSCVSFSLLQDMAREAWRNRLFARAEVLRDPSGLARRCQAAINDWFKMHPAVEAIWDLQEEEHLRCKTALFQGQAVTMEFPTWEAFADHVDRLVRNGLIER